MRASVSASMVFQASTLMSVSAWTLSGATMNQRWV
jgi:hypothetical protein